MKEDRQIYLKELIGIVIAALIFPLAGLFNIAGSEKFTFSSYWELVILFLFLGAIIVLIYDKFRTDKKLWGTLDIFLLIILVLSIVFNSSIIYYSSLVLFAISHLSYLFKVLFLNKQ